MRSGAGRVDRNRSTRDGIGEARGEDDRDKRPTAETPCGCEQDQQHRKPGSGPPDRDLAAGRRDANTEYRSHEDEDHRDQPSPPG